MSKRYRAELVKEIMEARAGGMTFADIKKRYKASAAAVKKWGKDFGINFKETLAITRGAVEELPRVYGRHISVACDELEAEGNLDKGMLWLRAVAIARGKA